MTRRTPSDHHTGQGAVHRLRSSHDYGVDRQGRHREQADRLRVFPYPAASGAPPAASRTTPTSRTRTTRTRSSTTHTTPPDPGNPRCRWTTRRGLGRSPSPRSATRAIPTEGSTGPSAGLTKLEPAAVACHDIVVHMKRNIAGAACGEQDPGLEHQPRDQDPDTTNPISIADDKSGSGGRRLPSRGVAHSVMFSNDGTMWKLGRAGPSRERLPDDDDAGSRGRGTQ